MYTNKIKIIIDIYGKVYINLPELKFKRKRFIGRIEKQTKTFYSSPRNTKKHLMKFINALGISYDFIKNNGKSFKYICVTLDKKKLWTSRKALFKYGQFLHFKKEGFEKQIFLKLKYWKRNKVSAQIERSHIIKTY